MAKGVLLMMNINSIGDQDYIHGIVCDVTNCIYNEEDNICTAKEIKVGPQYAASSADTICATFRPEQ